MRLLLSEQGCSASLQAGLRGRGWCRDAHCCHPMQAVFHLAVIIVVPPTATVARDAQAIVHGTWQSF